MGKQLVVFGATGQQGGSVINSVVHDSELSKEFKIRALMRDISKPASKALQEKGVEVMSANNDDQTSLCRALKGAHTTFVNIATVREPGGQDIELRQGRLIVETAVAEGVKYFIYSGSTNCTKNTNGKLDKNWIYDVKAEIEEHVRVQPLKSIIYLPGSFMQNFQDQSKPRPTGDGTYSVFSILAPTDELPLINIADTGKWITGVLANPDKYVGKELRAATGWYTCKEVAQIMSKVTGKTIRHQQIPDDNFKGFLPPPMAESLLQLMQYNRDYNYYGDKDPDRQGVEWAAKQARGKLTTFEEYLQKNPLQLD